MLGVAYVILIALFVFGSYWIQHEFEDAHNERCELLQVDLDLQNLTYEDLTADRNNQPDPDIEAKIARIAAKVKALCDPND